MSTAERVVIVAAIAVVIVMLIVWVARSYRRGGHGPPIQMSPLTKAGRSRVNRAWAKHGWAKPYDEDGDLLPGRERKAPEPPEQHR